MAEHTPDQPHEHESDKKVRTAWAADAEPIAELQVRAWRDAYAQALPQAALDQTDPQMFAEAWRQAIARPPSARHRVLVALDDDVVVGFAATAPNEDADANPAEDGEIVAFHVDPDRTGQGHGSRLLNACVDTLRADGFTEARIWLLAQDDAQRAYFHSSGWAADGAHRELDLADNVGATVRQVRLHADITEG